MCQIEGRAKRLILDTGSNVSILQPGVSDCELQESPLKPFGVTGEALEVVGQQLVSFTLGGKGLRHTFLVCPLPTEVAGLLGMDFFEKFEAEISFNTRILTWSDKPEVLRESPGTRGKSTALTVFVQDKARHSPGASKPKEPSRANDPKKDAQEDTAPSLDQVWLVRSSEKVTIEPRCRQIVTAKLEGKKGQSFPTLVCVEPAHIPMHGILPARVITRVGLSIIQHESGKAPIPNSRTHVMLANFGDTPITVPKSTVLGIAEQVSEKLVDQINTSRSCKETGKVIENVDLYHKLLGGKLDHLPRKDREKIEPVLLKYAHVFHDEESNDFKATDVVEHEINLNDPTPVRRPQYRTPFALRGEMKAQIGKMLEKGVIRESCSPWTSPAILVPKRSPDGKPKYRFCVDFRALNAVTKFDPYPLPVFEETTSTLHGSKYFSVLDCYSGFWQVKIKEEHKERTGFTVPSGHFEFNRLPFGLSNSPANFQRLMDLVLKDLIGDELHVFIDDVIIFSKTAEEHAARLEHVLERFDRASLQLHPQKCSIARPQVNYLGYVLSQDGITASPDKVKAVRNYPTPTNVREVRAFLGLASFYRRLVPDFAELSKHLTVLTKKDHDFMWGPEPAGCVRKIEREVMHNPCTGLPGF